MKKFLVPVVLQVEATSPNQAQFIASLTVHDGMLNNRPLKVSVKIGTPEELPTVSEVHDGSH